MSTTNETERNEDTNERRRWPSKGQPWTVSDSLRVLEHVERLWARVPADRRDFVRRGIAEVVSQAVDEGGR